MKNEIVKYENRNGDKMAAFITDFETIEYISGFKISFRLYNISQENGGFETTLWVKNASKDTARMFCGTKVEYLYAAKLIGATIVSKKTNNNVSLKYRFPNMRKIIYK